MVCRIKSICESFNTAAEIKINFCIKNKKKNKKRAKVA